MASDALALQVKEGLRKQEEDKSGSQETKKKKGSYYNSWDFRSLDSISIRISANLPVELMGSAT
jgi:hypothetical protein